MKRREILNYGVVWSSSLLMPPLRLNLDESFNIVFQGDSITDAGRNRSNGSPNNSSALGAGYVSHVATELLGEYYTKNLKIYNKGVSGDKVHQLAARWDDDCMKLKPDVLSIMIGVNDFWHTLTHGYNSTPELYKSDLLAILSRTMEAFPKMKLIIAEPFYVAGGTAVDVSIWNTKFPIYQQYSKEIAEHFSAAFIPLQSIFNEALKDRPASYWCPDGVHPSMAGSFLMAEAWTDTLEEIIY